MSENNTIEEVMPYTHKQEKAKSIARYMLGCSELQREIEMEVLVEEDKMLADFVKQEMEVLRGERAASPVQVVNSKDDLSKLPHAAQSAINDMLEQLGGVMPKGGLFQVKLDGVAGLDAAVDTIIANGTINLGSLIISKLAAEKAAALVQTITDLVAYAHKLKEEMPKSGTGNPKVREMMATLERIDKTIADTFVKHDLNAVIKLYKELMAPKPKTRKVKKREA